MDLKEICGATIEGVKWVAISGGIYALALYSLNDLIAACSEKIRSQKELERIVREEAKRLNCKKKVRAELIDSLESGSKKIGSDKYLMRVGGFYAKRANVRHELYHIQQGHCDDRTRIDNPVLNYLDYILRREPLAVAYAVFGRRK